MKISKTSLWLSVFVACLVLIASSTGLLLKSTYARETTPWIVQTYGQDIANLVAAAVLLVAVYLVNKGSVKASFVWIGVLITLLYAYIIYAFALHFNSLFLMYVAIVGLCFYILLSSMHRLHLDRLQSSFAATTTARSVSVFLLLLGILFAFQWLSEDVSALVNGKIPQSVVENGLLSNPVHVLDLGVLLPAMIITAISLWRRKFLGSLLAVPLLVFSVLTGIGILAAFLVMSSKDMPTSLIVEALFAVIILVSLVLSVLFLREVKEHKGVPIG